MMSLYLTFFDGEPGAEGYCAATKRDQAKIVFNDAKRLVRSSRLRGRIQVLVGNLHRESLAQS
jgi:phage terminase large subunit-like protein